MRAAYSNVSETRAWPIVIAVMFAVVVAVAVGGIYLLVQIHDMSENLSHLTGQFDTLRTMNTKLDTLAAMDRTLNQVNGKLTVTNGLLRASNTKLASALVAANQTSRDLDEMQRALNGMGATLGRVEGAFGAMRATLGRVDAALGAMGADIGRMTHKIINAKLLF